MTVQWPENIPSIDVPMYGGIIYLINNRRDYNIEKMADDYIAKMKIRFNSKLFLCMDAWTDWRRGEVGSGKRFRFGAFHCFAFQLFKYINTYKENVFLYSN